MLFSLNESKKAQYRKELTDLLPKKTEGKLNETQDKRFNWVLQVFSLKELTEIIKKYTYEQYKAANKNKKKVKDIEYEQINFFSLEELPENFNYLEVKVTLQASSFSIVSEDLVFEMASSHTIAEYKARNVGNDILLSISQT